MKAKDLQKAGIPSGPLLKLALSLMGRPAVRAELKKKRHITARLRNLVAAPDAFLDDPLFGELAKALVERNAAEASPDGAASCELQEGVPWRMWGSDIAPAGTYLAILSHSGSRGAGATIADHFSKVARDMHKGLPRQMQHLGWLPLGSDAGREYWQAMELMGMYAAANHEIIHHKLTRALKCQILFQMENHHNFAWKETHNRHQVIVHRKGATPAGKGVLGMIPGSMATPGFLVRGKGKAASLKSASHGAGRLMSRNEARNRFAWSDVKRELEAAGVTVLSAGVDEVPGAYKDIHKVMREQEDLVEIVARFEPRIVKMAP